ncbi:MAG: AAA family ATPase, partial [Desulfobacteraceae bacterium]|nr:AAA family ATPase [Desulfobacteraceae bacterium]
MEENYSGTRYKAPPLSQIIPRIHLLSYLKKRKDRKVFLIVGRAGQGKSALAADFLKRNRLQYTWLNLTGEERDPKLLLECIVRGMTGKISGKNALPAQPPLLDAFLNFVQEQTEGDHFIVFDNFQRVNSSREIGEKVEQLIALLPDRLHLIILSREYPHLSLTKLRIERDLVELRSDDLAFTEEEIHTLMQSQCQINLNHAQMRGITGVCEDWVTAFVSLIELLDSRPEHERNHLIETFVEQRKLPALDAFIEEEIFNPLSKIEKAVLTRLAGYTSIQALLATRLIGEDGVAVLKKLIKRNILLRWVDESLTIFSFHPIFATFLVE